MNCYEKCKSENLKCNTKECKMWLDFPEDLNCTYIAIDNNGSMCLREVGDRMGLTPSRIKQIESNSLSKVVRKFKSLSVL